MKRRSFFTVLFGAFAAPWGKLFSKPKPKGYFIAEFRFAAKPIRWELNKEMTIFVRSHTEDQQLAERLVPNENYKNSHDS